MNDSIPEPVIAAIFWLFFLGALERRDHGAIGAWGFCAVGYTFGMIGCAILRAIFT